MKKFIIPKMEIIEFKTDDMIVTSGCPMNCPSDCGVVCALHCSDVTE